MGAEAPGLPFHRAPVGQELRLPRLAMALGFSFGVLVWEGACYWQGVGGVGFNSSSSPKLLANRRAVEGYCAFLSCFGNDDDDGLLVRASAVLKRQGHKKLAPWETRPPLGAQKTRALSGAHQSCGKTRGKPRVGMAPHDATGPVGCVWHSFQFANGGGTCHYT